MRVESLEATAGFEPANKGFADPRLTTWPRRLGDLATGLRPRGSRGAGNGIRTRDPNLGKVVLYH